MRLEWLEDILAIARTGSLAGAAERRHVTQSAFSRRVQQIEDFVGVQLFDRSRKPVQLRPTTLAQSARIEQIAAALRQLVVDLRRGDRVSGNRIVIASQHSLTTTLAPVIIQRLQDGGEEVYVRLRSGNLDECLGMLLSRQVDMAIVYHLPGSDDEFSGEFLETRALGSDRLVPVIRADLAARFRDCGPEAEIPFVAYPGDVFFGRVMSKGILPAIGSSVVILPKAETALTLAAMEMAKVGVAVAWVPRSLAEAGLLGGTLADLSDALPSCSLSIRAARLQGSQSPAEAICWARLPALDDGANSLLGPP